jgi:hypothetical protein
VSKRIHTALANLRRENHGITQTVVATVRHREYERFIERAVAVKYFIGAAVIAVAPTFVVGRIYRARKPTHRIGKLFDWRRATITRVNHSDVPIRVLDPHSMKMEFSQIHSHYLCQAKSSHFRKKKPAFFLMFHF